MFCPGVGQVPLELEGPALPAHPWPAEPARDDFDGAVLAPGWSLVRTPREESWTLSERPGHLRLRPESLADRAHPSFVGRPQQHVRFAARAALDFDPAHDDECAGLVARRSEDFHLRLVVTTARGERVVRGVRRAHGEDEMIGEAPVAPGRVELAIEAWGQDYELRVADGTGEWRTLARVDGRLLSPAFPGDFVGTYLGMYASSQGHPSHNHADFDWFEYRELPE